MKKYVFPLAFLASVKTVSAHCPLCTVGAAAAAGGAAWLGVSEAAIGVFIGGFAVSIGWWMARVIKKKFIPYQKEAIILLSFATTVLPMLAAFGGTHPLYVSLFGSYGSLFNRTYLLDLFLTGSLVGGSIVWAAPSISRKLTSIRGKQAAYQGISITFACLVTAAIAFQVVM